MAEQIQTHQHRSRNAPEVTTEPTQVEAHAQEHHRVVGQDVENTLLTIDLTLGLGELAVAA